jgi:ATP-binding cassette subfamily B protein
VLQDSYLFSGSIYDNIHYGDPNASKEDVLAAAKYAMVHDIIMKLPYQYDTMLTYGGLNLSHGERQLVTIARAVLSKPHLLILDEATSSVDLKTEKEITKAMTRIMKGRTSFVIAHRLSTIRDADLILVLVDGEIMEQGSHGELLALNGFYAKMIRIQE